MAKEKKTYVKHTGPRGRARYVRIDQGYSYDQKLKKTVPDLEGKLSLRVVYEADEFAKIEKIVTEAEKEAGLKRAKNKPWAKEIDRETEEPTGRYEVKFWQYGKTMEGTKKSIPMFDAKGKVLPKKFGLTGGSVIIPKFIAKPYEQQGGGISLIIEGIQVVKLNSFADVSFDALDEDDGFEYVADGDDDGEDVDSDNPPQVNSGGSKVDF